MQVLLTSPGMGIGGAERVVAMLVTGLSARGHEVVLVAPPGMRDADLRGIEHVRVTIDDHGRAATGVLRTAAQLARVIRRSKPDVVHAQNVKSAAISRPRQPRDLAPAAAAGAGHVPRGATRGVSESCPCAGPCRSRGLRLHGSA